MIVHRVAKAIRCVYSPRIAVQVWALTFGLFLVNSTFAAPEEIQVYLDDFTEAGKIGLDLHTNYVAAGQAQTNNQFRLTPELSYGVNNNWDVAAYWLTVTDPNNLPQTDGVKVRARWRPHPPSPDSPFYWAVNFEVGQLSQQFYPDQSSAEIKLITEVSNDRWILGMNFNIDGAIKAYPVQAVSSEIDTKVSYRVGEDLRLGIENYSYLGPVRVSSNQPQSINQPQNSMSNYLVADFSVNKWDINAGIGFVSGDSTDTKVIKAIIGVPF